MKRVYVPLSLENLRVLDESPDISLAPKGLGDVIGPQSGQLLGMLAIFHPLLERGWEVDLTLAGDGVELQGIARYSPAKRINADEIEAVEQFASDAEYQLAVARVMAERAAGLEGKAKE